MEAAKFEPFERSDGEWAWRLIAANGDIVATDHGQGFRDRTDAARGIVDVVDAVLSATAKLALVALGEGEFPSDADEVQA